MGNENDISTLDILSTLSNVCSDKQIEDRFSIRYTTAKQWAKIDITNPKDGYKKFFVEYFRRINRIELERVQKSLDGFVPINEISLATITKIPLKVIQDYKGSLIGWKHDVISFFLSIDERLLKRQKDMVIYLINIQEYGPSVAKNTAQDPNKDSNGIIKLTDAQIEQGWDAPPTPEQLTIAAEIGKKYSKKVPPVTKLYAHRLVRWVQKIATGVSPQ